MDNLDTIADELEHYLRKVVAPRVVAIEHEYDAEADPRYTPDGIPQGAWRAGGQSEAGPVQTSQRTGGAFESKVNRAVALDQGDRTELRRLAIARGDWATVAQLSRAGPGRSYSEEGLDAKYGRWYEALDAVPIRERLAVGKSLIDGLARDEVKAALGFSTDKYLYVLVRRGLLSMARWFRDQWAKAS